jgi:hypothetical protein
LAPTPQDFFRKSITPEYTDIQRVDRDRVRGIVEFATREDLKRAIRDLDGATPDCLYGSCQLTCPPEASR